MAARANKKDKKRCFVIMPIGKEGTPEHEYNLGVYDSIIRPAAESCGYLVTRADLSFQTGNIPKHIIMQLAESELVIADLSERNANVYFELGIRHALARCGTIHVVEESKALPFDVAQYRAIKYSTHFTKIEATKRAIRDVIREKDQTTDASDNPVHDAIALPANYRDRGDEALRARLTALQTRVGELEKQNNDLLKRVADKSILLSEMDEASMEAAIDEAVDRSIKAIENSPVRLILQIREDVAQGKQMEVLESIRAALKSPYLEPEHIATLASIAQVSEMRALQNAVLEVGRLRFPGDIDFKRWLAESYVHSSDIDLKSKGLAILEEHLGISWDKNEVTIGKPFVDEAPGSLVIIADHYHTAEQYDRELALLQAAVKVWPDESKIMRNLARTYRSLGDEKKAEEFFHIALQKNPADDQA
ncbi:MAG: tetratricopeptide repeat protein, partial [Chloroflexi bacterium]|nr:tetratricopeptide repeat protein [Chloroflexota bacterium]